MGIENNYYGVEPVKNGFRRSKFMQKEWKHETNLKTNLKVEEKDLK